MFFAGLKVVSLESRRAAEMAHLIRKQQGEPIVAPSMREAPIERNEEAFRFAERLFAGEFDMMILLTGVGARILDQAIANKFGPGRFAEALRRMTVVVRGPKPAAVLREHGLFENAGRLGRTGYHRSARGKRHSSRLRAQPPEDGVAGPGNRRARRIATQRQAMKHLL